MNNTGNYDDLSDKVADILEELDGDDFHLVAEEDIEHLVREDYLF